MELILKNSVPGLGERGDIVTVRDGYARNYLLPKKLALPCTGAMKKVIVEETGSRG
jgi:large subunit ribosomal protein L9